MHNNTLAEARYYQGTLDEFELRPEYSEDGKYIDFPSPFEEYPGYVRLPRVLDAKQFAEWYQKARDPDNQERHKKMHFALSAWEIRHEWVVDWKMEGITTSQVKQADGLGFPDFRVLIWFSVLSEYVLEETTNLPNWPEQSSDQ